ncbi:MAG: hypothetical protein KC486_35765, partial [Myxococcales bacterium]|nr:hypothetical protein [Myxococcales bacterium]
MSRQARLDAVIADARAEVRAQIAAGGRVRDFAAMIARAQELDPAAISEATRAEAADFASVVALGR